MTLAGLNVGGIAETKKADAATFTNLNQSEIVSAMGAGWNLGNQLEAALNGTPSETAWGNPTITSNLIKAVKKAGFSSHQTLPIILISIHTIRFSLTRFARQAETMTNAG